MIEIVKDKRMFKVVNETTREPVIKEQFLMITRTRDFEGYYIGKTAERNRILFNKSGEVIYKFAAGVQVNGVGTLLDEIAKKPELIKQIKSLTFFTDYKVRESLFSRHKKHTELLIEDAIKRGEPIQGYQILCEAEESVMQRYYIKMIATHNRKKAQKKGVLVCRSKKNLEKIKE